MYLLFDTYVIATPSDRIT